MSDNLVGLDYPIIYLSWDDVRHVAYIELVTYSNAETGYNAYCWDAPNGEPRMTNIQFADSMETPIRAWLEEHYRVHDGYTYQWGGSSEYPTVNLNGIL